MISGKSDDGMGPEGLAQRSQGRHISWSWHLTILLVPRTYGTRGTTVPLYFLTWMYFISGLVLAKEASAGPQMMGCCLSDDSHLKVK